jgi:hypothetical protein
MRSRHEERATGTPPTCVSAALVGDTKDLLCTVADLCIPDLLTMFGQGRLPPPGSLGRSPGGVVVSCGGLVGGGLFEGDVKAESLEVDAAGVQRGARRRSETPDFDGGFDLTLFRSSRDLSPLGGVQ